MSCNDFLHAFLLPQCRTGKVVTNAADQSSVKNIYAIGDVAEGRPEVSSNTMLHVKRLEFCVSYTRNYRNYDL